MYELEEILADLDQHALRRRLRLISGPQGPRVLLDGKPVLLLCSNNYLGLADHPRVREAAAEGAMRWGVGAGASRLVCGSMTIHRRLEERLAAFKRTEACVLFGSGYLANLGVIEALAGRGDAIFSDELNHASIIDGCRLSRARVVTYRHRDMEHLDWCLHRNGGDGRRLVVTDSVFSMDGDTAPLPELVEIAHRHDARTLVDEAHATGVLGPGGRGAVAAAGLEGEIDVLVGTLGKALGSYGAYVCAQETTVQYLINRARSLIFSTAPGPPAVAGALAALKLIEERPHRLERLRMAARAMSRGLRDAGFAVEEGDMHIIPLVIGDERAASALSQAAVERGIFVQAIRPPSVPAGTTRLRLTVMASHTGSELRAAARVLARLAREQGLDPALIGPPGHAEADSEELVAVAPGLQSRQPTDDGWFHEPSEQTIVGAEPADPHATSYADLPATQLFDVERDGALRPAAQPGKRTASLVRPMAGIFVTGTDTGVGKTMLSAALVAAMAASGQRVHAHKPVLTGLDDEGGRWPADHELLGAAAHMAPEDVAPLRFQRAVAPHLAAELEHRTLTAEQIVANALASREHAASSGAVLVVEGVGGLLCPLTVRLSVADLAAELELPTVIAARPGLGTINHTLLTLEAARWRGLDVRAVLLTPWSSEPSPMERSNRETIARLGKVDVQGLGAIDGPQAPMLARAGARLPWRSWLAPRPPSAGARAGTFSRRGSGSAAIQALTPAGRPADALTAASIPLLTAASSSSSTM